MNNNIELVKVENLKPHLRRSYGATQMISREKAYKGVQTGHYRIVHDPLAPIKKAHTIAVTQDNANVHADKLVSIIILTMNQLVYTQKCINSIMQYTQHNYQLVIVDNASDDDTVKWVKSNLREQDILLCNGSNKGFSVGNNQGLAVADGMYVLFMNNDVAILENLWLDIFLDNIDDADMIGPTMRKLIIDKGGHIFVYAGDGRETDPYNYLEGWCLFGKKAVFQDLGGFDVRFSPAYSEDADLSFAAQIKGYKLKRIENKKLKHFGNVTSQTLGSRLSILSTRNRKLLYNKWVGGDVKTICIRRAGAIGDVLMTTPIIRALKNKYPAADITYVTNSPQMLENNPHIENIVTTEKKVYDKDITLAYEDFPGEIRIDTMARQAEVTLSSRRMEVFFPEIEINLPEKYIVIHTGISWKNRMWPIDRWKQLCDMVRKDNDDIYLYFVGTKQTDIIEGDNSIDARSKGWSYVATLLKKAMFFLGIDSAVSNLAKAVRCKAYIFYGCVNPKVMLADADETPLIYREIDCFGCRDKSSEVYVECIKDEPYCLTNIKAKEVYEKIKNNIKKENQVDKRR